jgi:hypothetical protein
MLDVADGCEPVGEGGDSDSVADENISPLHLKRAIGEVSAPPEVVEHLLEAVVVPRDGVVAGDCPDDAGSNELFEVSARAPRVELVLRLVQPVETAAGGARLPAAVGSPARSHTARVCRMAAG